MCIRDRDCTAHFIREEVLRKIVLNQIFAVTAMFYEDITAFMELIQKQRFDEAEKDIKRKRREVGQARKRIAELDRIFKRIYEDDINGTISHERFLKLSAEYEAEQKELTEKVKAEQQEVDTYEPVSYTHLDVYKRQVLPCSLDDTCPL